MTDLAATIAAVLLVAALALGGCSAGEVRGGAGGGVDGDVDGSASSVADVSASEIETATDSPDGENPQHADKLLVNVNGTSLEATLADNPATSALVELLEKGPMTVSLREYGGFEKVGPLPQALPTSDEQVSGQPGDILLYQGNQITLFYGTNSWSYTRLAHIDGATQESLTATLGTDSIEATLSLP